MKLLTEEIRRRLPPLYASEHLSHDQVIVQAKFFTPDANWTWYAIEAGAVVLNAAGEQEIRLSDVGKEHQVLDITLFGLVVGFHVEMGYFSLSELQAVRGPYGLAVERDLWFRPTPLSRLPEYKRWAGREGP